MTTSLTSKPMLRLIADDLTGALDSGVAFASQQQPLIALPNSQGWQTLAATQSAVLNLDTRDSVCPTDDLGEARGFYNGADLRYCKLDSLLRGFSADHVHVCQQDCKAQVVVIAPAFPAQGRVMVNGIQHAQDQALSQASSRFKQRLKELGYNVQLWSCDDLLPDLTEGPDESLVLLCDAQTDADLQKIVRSVLAHADLQDVLWVGSGGLARALARPIFKMPAEHNSKFETPLMLLVASHHPVSRQQLEHLQKYTNITTLKLTEQRLEPTTWQRTNYPLTLIHLQLEDVTLDEAKNILTMHLTDLVQHAHAPEQVIVSGGTTLSLLCEVAEVTQLELTGDYQPGMPTFTFCGGPWHGTAAISKSGAFGEPSCYSDLVGEVLTTSFANQLIPSHLQSSSAASTSHDTGHLVKGGPQPPAVTPTYLDKDAL